MSDTDTAFTPKQASVALGAPPLMMTLVITAQDVLQTIQTGHYLGGAIDTFLDTVVMAGYSAMGYAGGAVGGGLIGAALGAAAMLIPAARATSGYAWEMIAKGARSAAVPFALAGAGLVSPIAGIEGIHQFQLPSSLQSAQSQKPCENWRGNSVWATRAHNGAYRSKPGLIIRFCGYAAPK